MESSCIQVCVIDAKSGLCTGCGRTIEEISRWLSMTDAERRRIMAQLPRRKVPANTES